ncbi:hypothetical protein HGP28_13080 [Vibrio sp. SM6]|uniref:Uncharacterized protein n=1 Tax=Vibrio agarilyticus TaxID=2726741 RepID=A0A7X8YHQ4_9VIBR|nr:hypothetical protein [Vibrio agarilyticus]NLS13825.1 hypothetical protein [Vibrio agarilyticus]
MRKIIFSVGIVASLILSMVGCGGSGEESSDTGSAGSGSTGISFSSYVNGSFKSMYDPANSSSAIVRNLDPDNQNDLGYCGYGEGRSSDRYYESARVIVVGSDSLPADDFRWGATLGEWALDRALAAMKISHSKYIDMKSGISVAASQGITQMIESIYANTGFVAEYNSAHYQSILENVFNGNLVTHSYGSEIVPNLSSFSGKFATDTDSARRAIRVALAAMSANDELTLYYDLYNEMVNQGIDVENELGLFGVIPENIEKMVVCLSASRSNSEWGMGTRQGFEVAAKSATQRSDDLQIATHEVIHHLQATITEPTIGGASLERWFSEGQAIVLSGMKANTGNHSRRTLDVINASDGADYYATHGDNEYPDYGQAYNWFVRKFGSNAQFELLYQLRASRSMDLDTSGYSAAFVDEFNKLAKPNCDYDCRFELTDFRADYPNQNK